MKLFPLLTARKLPPRYNLIPFLTVHDPEADVKSRVSSIFFCGTFSDIFAGHLLCCTRITKHIRKYVLRIPPSQKPLMNLFPLAVRVDLFEIIFIRLLHLLAHHPDFLIAHENLQEMAK